MNLTGKGGFQERKQHINRRGRPRSFNQIRALAQAIAHEPDPQNPSMTTVEAILRSWAMSKNPLLQKSFVEVAFGKVPDRIETTGLENKPTLILHWPHERPGWQPPDDWANHRSGRVFPRNLPDGASNGEGTRRPLLSNAD